MKEEFGFSMFDENDDVSIHAMRKPKTMDNNCVNLQCLNNRQKLIELKDKYDNLEKKYFDLEKEESNKCEEYNDLLNKKKNELEILKKYNNIYLLHNINDLNYYELKDLDSKLENLLKGIKNEKLNKLKKTSFPLNKKSCIACYTNEISIIFKPCNHLCICEKCSEKVNSCPMCRKLISSKIKVKLPTTSMKK